jgi:hypothetical protein
LATKARRRETISTPDTRTERHEMFLAGTFVPTRIFQACRLALRLAQERTPSKGT